MVKFNFSHSQYSEKKGKSSFQFKMQIDFLDFSQKMRKLNVNWKLTFLFVLEGWENFYSIAAFFFLG
jgi:hypothetical protein